MNFLNFHILHAVPYSNLNRDDMGSPKSLMYGGTNRARLSSQSLKRAARIAFEARSTADRTTRSTKLGELITERALDLLEGVDLTEADRKAITTTARKQASRLTSKDADAKDTLVWLAEAEIEGAALAVAAAHGGGDLEDDYVTPSTASLSVAMFGRMFAAMPQLQTEAAVQVAHAFTTHTANTEVDYFTAVDDLRLGLEGDAGAGYLETAEFTSGVFYRYFNIDRDQLLSNWSASAAEDAQSRLEDALSSLTLNLPTGKVNSTAPAGLPAAVLVEAAAQPLSYATAFESPVAAARGGGFTSTSIEHLLAFAERSRWAAGPLYGPAWHCIPGATERGMPLHDVISMSAAHLLKR